MVAGRDLRSDFYISIHFVEGTVFVVVVVTSRQTDALSPANSTKDAGINKSKSLKITYS